MVVILDEVVEVYRSCPAYQWHDSLEKTEAEGYGEEVAHTDALECESACDSYGEAVHCESDSGKPYF